MNIPTVEEVRENPCPMYELAPGVVTNFHPDTKGYHDEAEFVATCQKLRTIGYGRMAQIATWLFQQATKEQATT